MSVSRTGPLYGYGNLNMCHERVSGRATLWLREPTSYYALHIMLPQDGGTVVSLEDYGSGMAPRGRDSEHGEGRGGGRAGRDQGGARSDGGDNGGGGADGAGRDAGDAATGLRALEATLRVWQVEPSSILLSLCRDGRVTRASMGVMRGDLSS